MYFNVDMSVRRRWNNVVIFNVDMNDVGKRRSNVVKMTISKKKNQIRSFNYSFTTFFNLPPMLIEYVEEYLQCRENFLNIMKDTALLELNLNCFTL